MRLKQFMNAAIVVFGILSSMSFLVLWAALHDIWHDFASPEVWTRAGKDLPAWYSLEVNPCPGEWRAVQICFLILLVFHVLLFTRWIVNLFLDAKAAAIRRSQPRTA